MPSVKSFASVINLMLKTLIMIMLIFNTNIEAQSLEIDGKLQIADDASPASAGQLRYRDGDFEGNNGIEWSRLGHKLDTVQISINPFAFRPETDPLGWDITIEKLSKNGGADSAVAIVASKQRQDHSNGDTV